MRTILAAIILIVAHVAPVAAGCRQPGTYPDIVTRHSVQRRSFYLLPTRASISAITDSANDSVSFIVKFGGKVVCSTGHSSSPLCRVNVRRKGVRYIYVKNTTNRSISYNLICADND